ncbi:MAG TPA: hypothetical protein VF469_09695 [Kofleriaceae bacterium]
MDVVTLVGTFLGGSFVSTLWTQYRQRREKQEERELVRAEAHRTELRHAYAGLLATYAKALYSASYLTSYISVMRKRPNPAIPAEGMKLWEDYRMEHLAAQTQLAEVLLLEDNKALQELLLKLRGRVAVNVFDTDEASQDLRLQRETFETLTLALAGSFSPKHWDAVRVETARLTSLDAARLPDALPDAARGPDASGDSGEAPGTTTS